MSDATRGELVQIKKVVLEPAERPDTLPESTKAVPYQCWIKGVLVDEQADIGDPVTIETFIGRRIGGTLYEVAPIYDHGFGVPRRELLSIGELARGQLREKKGND